MSNLKPINGAVLVFDNLNIACFDALGDAGEQIPELQKSLPTLFAEHAERCGYDANGVVIETTTGKWRLFRTDDGGWNRNKA